MNADSMTNRELIEYLITTADVVSENQRSYAAGYFESTLLTLMERFPEVRQEIQDRVTYRADRRSAYDGAG